MLVGWVAGLLLGMNVAQAAESPVPADSSPPRTHTVYLDSKELDDSVMQRSLSLNRRAVSFAKEPDLGKRKVWRGAIPSAGNTNQGLAFLWDPGLGALFVDLNRNRDLTDDRGGVWKASFQGSQQSFRGVRLPYEAPAGRFSVLADVHLYRFGDWASGYASLRSLWHGRIDLQDQVWQLAVLGPGLCADEALTGSLLLLRSWDLAEKPIGSMGEPSSTFPFTRHVFFGNRAYELDLRWEKRGEAPNLRAQLTEQQPKLGELTLAGNLIERVLLTDPKNYTVLLDRPAPTVKVPLGVYATAKVWLKKDAVVATSDEFGGLALIEKPVVWAVGGPLTNSVAASARGRNLVLNYRLIGAGGQSYQLLPQDRSKPPQFTIRQGDRQIAAGNFEFG
jgi:hypothetical protein